MNAPAKIKPSDAGTEVVALTAEIVVAEPKRGEVVLFDRDAYDQFEARLREDLKSFVPDLTTATGRKAIASKAFEVVKVKTTLDNQAKALTEEWRTKTSAVNAGRRIVVDRLAALAAEVRQPLTDWEEAEKARVETCQDAIAQFRRDAVVTLDDTAATVRQRGTDVWNIVLDAEKFGDMLPEAEAAKAHAVETLKAALARLTKEDADRAELERLRAENEAREAREREEALAREAKEREEEEARQAEQRRQQAAQAEADRIRQAEEAAAQRAREEAERAAQAERDRIDAERQAEVDAANERARIAEEAAEAERQRIAQAERDRVDEERRVAEEAAKRAADQAHRTEVKSKAKTAIMSCGADEETARKIVMAIIAGEVPAVRMEF